MTPREVQVALRYIARNEIERAQFEARIHKMEINVPHEPSPDASTPEQKQQAEAIIRRAYERKRR